jgi:hypothetical protein
VSIEDSTMTRDVLRDIGKHPVDISELQIHVQHGVVYISGRIGKVRGYYADIDLHEEFQLIVKVLRQKMGIRDVCCDVQLNAETLKEKLSPHPRRVQY